MHLVNHIEGTKQVCLSRTRSGTSDVDARYCPGFDQYDRASRRTFTKCVMADFDTNDSSQAFVYFLLLCG
jgi:hypothetical protein